MCSVHLQLDFLWMYLMKKHLEFHTVGRRDSHFEFIDNLAMNFAVRFPVPHSTEKAGRRLVNFSVTHYKLCKNGPQRPVTLITKNTHIISPLITAAKHFLEYNFFCISLIILARFDVFLRLLFLFWVNHWTAHAILQKISNIQFSTETCPFLWY